ncbi:hypothetical protein C6T61_25450 [Burkholderia multivorans]|nr:hypothetical protein C6T61_25450 [Burkholderia multivorans]
MGQMSTTATVDSMADSAILAALIAAIMKMDGAKIEAFRKSVHQLISAPASDPSEAAIVQLAGKRVDAVINMAKTFSGN